VSTRKVTLSGLTLLIVACSRETAVEVPPPQELSREHIGYYCNMIVADHQGPKGQIHLSNGKQPVWFTSVRDTITFTLLPGEPKNIAVIYVNDMAKASWATPEAGTWIEARDAWYVIGSDRRGGMGAPEPVPFSDRQAAARFSESHGGSVVAYAELPPDYFLSVASASPGPGTQPKLEKMHE